MSQSLKISRKTLALPKVSSQGWTFEIRPGGWIIAESNAGLRRKFMMQEGRGRIYFSLRGHLCMGEWLQVHRDVSGGGSDSDLTAQFPGKVRKILVEEGTAVAEGDSLLLVEAMKMEFSIRAPYPGRVSKILVQEGQQLSPGDLFVELEAMKSG